MPQLIRTEHYQTKKTRAQARRAQARRAQARFLEEIGIAAPCFSATKSDNEPYLTKSYKRGFAVNYTTMSYNELRSILYLLSRAAR